MENILVLDLGKYTDVLNSETVLRFVKNKIFIKGIKYEKRIIKSII